MRSNTLKSLEFFRKLNRAKTNTKLPAVRKYQAPSLGLLKSYDNDLRNAPARMDPAILQEKLHEFELDGQVVNVRQGPVISRYEVKLANGVRLGKVRAVAEDLGLALMADHIRIQAPIPGTSLVGFEVANKELATIGLNKILAEYVGDQKLPMAIGVDTVGKPRIFDLAKMPHLLIAGQTGSGKSVCLNSIILSLIFTKTPEQVQLILVDPKRVEMASYRDIPHLNRPVIVEPAEATEAFRDLTVEMERRYQVFAEAGVRNIESYNASGLKMPYIVVIVDEMADLMMTSGKDLETMIVRLAQLSRAVGIHLVLATQKPIVKVITGLIKSNMPSRIAFQVASKGDSRVILDTNGAESLVGRGDMLMAYPGAPEPERFHGAWVSDGEISAVTDSLKE
jgi:DNA segregation ATPase FtsK/SpoIIIE, S-DNA-T family